MESIMLPQNQTQNEDSRRIDGHPPPMIEVEVLERSRSRTHWLVPAVALIAVAALLGWGIWSRVNASATLRAETAQTAVPAVSVVSSKQTAPAQEILLPGNVQPFITSPIYARTNGYLRKWYVDIG